MSDMHKKVLVLLAAAAVVSSIVAGCGRSAVAKINGRAVTRQEYYSRLEHMLVNQPQGQAEAGVLVLRDLINDQLLLGLAEKEHVPPTDKQVDERVAEAEKSPMYRAWMRTTGLTKDQARQMMRVQQAHFNLMTRGVRVSEKQVRDFYDKNKDSLYTQPEMASVAGIFAETRKTADEAMALLQKGVDFGTVAMRLSSDRVSAQAGGRLGKRIYRGDPQLPKAVVDQVLSTSKGKYTSAIPGDKGFVIFQVLEKFKKRVQPFREVRYAIWTDMMLQAGGRKNDLEPLLRKFHEQSKIQVNVERYKEYLEPKKTTPAAQPGGAKPPAPGTPPPK